MQREENFFTKTGKEAKKITFNKVILVSNNKVVKKLLSFEFSNKELELLKYGLPHLIPPMQLKQTKIFTTLNIFSNLIPKFLHLASSLLLRAVLITIFLGFFVT